MGGWRIVSARLLVLAVAAATTLPAAAVPSRLPAEQTVMARPPSQRLGLTDLETETGLSMVITSMSSRGLAPQRPLRLAGTVTNTGDHPWTDAKVYLSIASEPAISKAGLDAFAADEDGFGTTINDLGLFDQIGRLDPGSRTSWHLAVPFQRLPLGSAGVYQVGATLLASNAEGRDQVADARIGTTIPYLTADLARPRPTAVVTLIPLTAPVVRRADGTFVDDSLATLVSSGGRLRNVVDLAARAPPKSLELVVDPALRQAVQDMAKGYAVQSLDEQTQGIDARAGTGQLDAAAWLDDLEKLRQSQRIALLPWGNPASSSLADAELPGVVDAAVVSSQRYASEQFFNQSVVDWQNNGATTRRGLAVSRRAGAAVHVVSEDSLPALSNGQPGTYPPAQVTVNTQPGPLTAVVARSDIGGEPFTSSLTAVEFRQAIMAEATVRSLGEENLSTSVIAAPFNWDPGMSSLVDLAAGYHYPTVAAESLSVLAQRLPRLYQGSVQLSSRQPALSTAVLDAIKGLRDTGRVYTDLLTEHRKVAMSFDQQLAESGSSVWRWQPKRGAALTHQLSRRMAGQVSQVSLTGPAFVAMSSSSGPFPLTVSNGLDVAVTVNVSVDPLNKALQITPIETLHLGPGQSRDIQVQSKADGSGLTQVRARLSTASGRPFGRPLDFNIRATQIGLAIWVAMGVGLVALFLSAARRIYKRARGEGFQTRAKSTA